MTEYTRESLIEKARELASRQEGPLTCDDFIKLTGISDYFIRQQFPDRGWSELADLAGVPRSPQARNVGIMTEYSRESLIEKARELASRQDKPLTCGEFTKLTGISRYFIDQQFPDRGWSEIADLSKIPRHPNAKRGFSNEDLLAEFHSIVKKTGRIPSLVQFNAYAKFSSGAIIGRFGGIRGILKPYKEWLMANEPNSPYIELVDTKSKHELTGVSKTPSQVKSVTPQSPEWSKGNGIVYGLPISFRGLRHAPVNEQGVVYLFGMVAQELGLMVESVQAAFPDCEAKRCVDSRRNHWQRIRIEFEYLSSNYQTHGHDVQGCDLIVCWEHDWAECPIEVIELRSVIDKLEA